jgi:hypothetical protein
MIRPETPVGTYIIPEMYVCTSVLDGTFAVNWRLLDNFFTICTAYHLLMTPEPAA